MTTDELKLKTVAVLGGSYGGNRAAQVLAAGLPSGWRVVLIDRNSHFNHVYNLSRYTVLPGHEHKAFIPYDNLFRNPSDPTSSHPHKRVHGTITSLHPHHLTYKLYVGSDLATSTPSLVEPAEEHVLHFDYAIYALGSHLPSPIDLWGSRDTVVPSKADLEKDPQCNNLVRPYTGMKQDGVSWIRARQRGIVAARRVLIVGGGALGIQFASDIAAVYPRKSVTLLHSRKRLLPRFDDALGDEVYQSLEELGVRVIFGERLDMSSLNGDETNESANGETMLVKTVKGREIEADLVLLCTGQKPNTSLLQTMDSRTIDPQSGMVRVSRTMQILACTEKDTEESVHSITESLKTRVELVSTAPVLADTSTQEMLAEPEADVSFDSRAFVYPHLFAVGDAADSFGACKAGHTAYYQGEVAARNVIRLIQGNAHASKRPLRELMSIAGGGGMEGDSSAEWDSEGDLELEEYEPGLPMIKVSLGLTKSAYEVAGVVGTKDDGTDDLGAAVVWGVYGYKAIDEQGMWM